MSSDSRSRLLLTLIKATKIAVVCHNYISFKEPIVYNCTKKSDHSQVFIPYDRWPVVKKIVFAGKTNQWTFIS